MLSMEAWAAVRHLHAQGHSVRRISRELHLSRQAVRRALGSPQPPRYQRKPTENQQLAPYVELIQHMTTKQGLIGSRVLSEIRARGYEGSVAPFYRLWSRLRPTQPDPRVTERFVPAPGSSCTDRCSGTAVGSSTGRASMRPKRQSMKRSRKHFGSSRSSTMRA